MKTETIDVTKELKKAERKRKIEERDRKLRCWDASLGHYWKLRRPLDNDDWVYINRRKQAGESLGEIFKSMGVLK